MDSISRTKGVAFKDVNKLIVDTVKFIEEIVSSTYGPEGSTVIITNEHDEPYATKDGVSVARSLWSEDPFRQYIIKLIQEVSEKTLEEAGDGTTTSIILSSSLIRFGSQLLGEGVPYSILKEYLEDIEDMFIEFLKDIAKDITSDDELYNVALIASNGDKNIAKIVSEAYKHSNSVYVEEGDSFEDKLEAVNGMKLLASYYDSSFINNMRDKSIVHEDCQVIILDRKLESLKNISGIISKTQPCIIIGEDFNEDVVALLKQNHNRNIIDVAIMRSPGIGSHRKDLLEDIACYTGGEVLDASKVYINPSVTGQLSGIEIKKDYSVLFNKNRSKELESRIEELEEYYNSSIEEHEKDKARLRLEGLKGSTSIIKVGGNSTIEIKERLDRIDDASRAVDCAIEEGVVKGGGSSFLLFYSSVLESDVGGVTYDLIESLTMPAIKLGIEHEDIEDLDESIIDPVKVIRTAFQNAMSVSKVLLSTKAIVLNEREWNR